ncbi:MAG: Ig-like domain-containing domain [Planctomycetota bacterium]|jgi:hypothetical protein
MTIRLNSTLAGAALVASLTLGSCGGGSDNESGGGQLSLTSCSLGCAFSASGPASCAISDVFVNQVIWAEFTEPVDISTVNGSTFQVFNSITGQTPPGLYTLDPSNPRRVFFQPTLTFDSSGSPSFGFDLGESYELRILGRNTTPDGPVILSAAGQENQTELNCFVIADEGVADIVPGAPEADVFLQELDDNGLVINEVNAAGATDVALNSRLRMVFNDVMNPASLVNPALQTSDTISVAIDPDGDIANPEDQLELPGEFLISVDTVSQTTEVLFLPEGGFPSAGGDLLNPRKIVVTLPAAIIDLGGNSLANTGDRVFETIAVAFPQTTLVEDFTSNALVDQVRSGMFVEPAAETVQTLDGGSTLNLTGRATPGFGGGSGVLGDLVLDNGEIVVLSTDASIPVLLGPSLITGPKDALGETLVGNPAFDEAAFFSDPISWVNDNPGVVGELHVQTTLIDNYFITGDDPGEANLTITDGTFPFASVRLLPSSQLKFVGSNPARLFARGDMIIQGLIDLAGRPPGAGASNLAIGEHISSEGFGAVGGLPGPNGGAGGRGGDRPDSTGTGLIGAPGLNGFLHTPGAVIDIDGSAGEGRGGVAPVVGNDAGAGSGGLSWPNPLPGPTKGDLGGFEPDTLCGSNQVGGVGAGGSFSAFGQPGQYIAPGSPQPVAPPASQPGNELLRVTDIDLDPDLGDGLVGGSGGGGGGAGIQGTKTNGSFITQCLTPIIPGPLELLTYFDHSAAAGGGGGGAIQLQAGSGVNLGSSASIRAGGGDGGNAVDGVGLTSEDSRAAPGGGGSGGSVLIQAIDLGLAAVPGLIDISGGRGGASIALGAQPSVGGSGSPGIVQLFNSPDVPLNLGAVAGSVNGLAGDDDPGVFAEDFLQVGDWLGTQPGTTNGPSSRSGIQSCWLIPEGSVFSVEYLADDVPNDFYGWNMKVQLSSGFGVVDFRGDSGLLSDQLGGLSLEDFLTAELGASPLVVRFQGARTLAGLVDPCNAVEGDPLVLGSITPWLKDPSELNTYWDTVPGLPAQVAAQRRPNVIRYQIVFDGSQDLGPFIESIVELSIETQPN